MEFALIIREIVDLDEKGSEWGWKMDLICPTCKHVYHTKQAVGFPTLSVAFDDAARSFEEHLGDPKAETV